MTAKKKTDENIDETPAELTGHVAQPVAPVTPHRLTRRSDEDAIFGSFVDVVDGEHKGRRGAFEQVLSRGKDGYPHEIAVRSRDARNELLSVLYSHVRPTDYTGGR